MYLDQIPKHNEIRMNMIYRQYLKYFHTPQHIFMAECRSRSAYTLFTIQTYSNW